jgi:hypothetical protein
VIGLVNPFAASMSSMTILRQLPGVVSGWHTANVRLVV